MKYLTQNKKINFNMEKKLFKIIILKKGKGLFDWGERGGLKMKEGKNR